MNFETVMAQKLAEGALNEDRFFERYKDDTRRWALEKDDSEFLRKITISRAISRPLWSNQHVRRAAQSAMITEALTAYSTNSSRSWLWVTLAWDQGISWERTPEFDFVALRNVAQHHLRRAGLEGVGIVEIDTWKNFTGEPGRRMVAHIHFLGWAKDAEAFDLDLTRVELNTRRALVNSLGVPVAVIKLVTPSPESMAHLAMYMTKLPAAAKNRVMRDADQRIWSATHATGAAARLVEVLSHLEFGDVFFSVGRGKEIAHAVRHRVRSTCAQKIGKDDAPSREAVRQHWLRIRLVNGSQRFVSPNIIAKRE